MIGGGGERKTLRLVARYADACNLFGAEVEAVAHKLEVLKRHCETENRDYGSIEKTILVGRSDPLDDVDAFLAQMEEMAELGVEQVWLSARTSDPAAWVSEVCERTVGPLAELG